MSRRHPSADAQSGFTLLETVVTIVIGAVLGAMLIQFMSSGLVRSTVPLTQSRERLALTRILEEMTLDYKRLAAAGGDVLPTFKSWVENGNDTSSTPYYGAYSVNATYIAFASGDEVDDTAGSRTILKVTVRVADQAAAALYTQ